MHGKMSSGTRTFDVKRTTTVVIKDVGATRIEIPEEAKPKLKIAPTEHFPGKVHHKTQHQRDASVWNE